MTKKPATARDPPMLAALDLTNPIEDLLTDVPRKLRAIPTAGHRQTIDFGLELIDPRLQFGEAELRKITRFRERALLLRRAQMLARMVVLTGERRHAMRI